MDTMISSDPHYWGPILSTQPMGYKELVKRSLRLYFASFSEVIMLSFLLALVVFSPRLISYIVGYDIFFSASSLTMQLLLIVAIDFIAFLLVIAIFWRLHCVAHYKHEGFKEDFDVGIHKVIYVFIAVMIQCLIIFGISGLVFLLQLLLYKHHLLFFDQSSSVFQIFLSFVIFIGQLAIILYLFTLFIFLTPLIAIENKPILESIKRSVSLTWNHWWRVFSTQISPWIYFTIFTLSIKFLIGLDIHIYFVGEQTLSLASTVLQMILFTLFIIWPTALVYIQLKDLELRKKAKA